MKTIFTLFVLLVTNCFSPFKYIQRLKYDDYPCFCHQATGSVAINCILDEECVETGDSFIATLTCDSIDNLRVKNTSTNLFDVDITYVNNSFSIIFENMGYSGEYVITLESETNNTYSDVASFYVYSDGENDCGSFNCIEEAKYLYYLNYMAPYDELIILGVEEAPLNYLFDMETYELTDELLDFVFNTGGGTITCARNTNQNNNDKIVICGTAQWYDSNNILHTLKDNKINIYGWYPTLPYIINESVYTDENGYFSKSITNLNYLGVPNLNPYIFITIPSETHSSFVTLGTLPFTYLSSIVSNVTKNTTINYSITINPQISIRDAAYEISQATIVPYKYVQALENATLPCINIQYPHLINSTFYNNDLNYIVIALFDYSWWDIVIHEYCHYVDDWFNFSANSCTGIHNLKEDLCNRDTGIINGLKLAFKEGLANYLSLASQLYFSNELNIPYTCDYKYCDCSEDFNQFMPLQGGINDYAGEGCEGNVIGLLIKLMDNVNRADDEVSLGHQEMWNCLRQRQNWCLAKLIDVIIERNPSQRSSIGKLLEKENFACHRTSLPSNKLSGNPNNVSWTFSWDLFKHNVVTPDSFDIHFEGGGANSIDVLGITNTWYTPTDDQKRIMLSWPNDSVTWYVTSHTSNINDYIYPFTGCDNTIPKKLIGLVCDENDMYSYSAGETQWYKIIAPKRSIFRFQSSGNANVSGELFSSMVLDGDTTGCLASSNLNGTGNFVLDYKMAQNQILYLRVKNKSPLGKMITISFTDPHICNYTYSYQQWSSTQHLAFCECDSSIIENHITAGGMGVMGFGYESRCTKCGYYFTNPVN